MYGSTLNNSYFLQTLERALGRPLILGLTILEAIIATLYVSLVSRVIQRLLDRNGSLISLKDLSQKMLHLTNKPQSSDYLRVGKRSALAMSGFTIIEVLIVLAIAGLIILIVLLAVPALQRGNRNSTRKKDITRIAGATVNFVTTKNGALPRATSVSLADANVILTDAGSLGQYSLTAAATAGSNSLSIVAAGAGTPAALATNLTDAVQIVTGGVCSSANDGSATNAGANSRSISIQYTIETGTANTSQPLCQNS